MQDVITLSNKPVVAPPLKKPKKKRQFKRGFSSHLSLAASTRNQPCRKWHWQFPMRPNLK